MDEKNEKLRRLRQEIINQEASLSANTSEIGDYRIIKCYEAALAKKDAPYDVDALIAERQKVRDKINELEAEIAALEAEAE
ncbi:MAG: hypothetical protein ACI3U2_11080 [Anaerovibrio sp.]